MLSQVPLVILTDNWDQCYDPRNQQRSFDITTFLTLIIFTKQIIVIYN